MTTSEFPQAPERTMEPRGKEVLPRERVRPGPVFRPDVDIVERPEEYLVTADLPGVGEHDLQVQLADGVLAIDAQPSVLPDESWQAVHAEYRIGAYHREFTMSEAIDADAISARMRDGVLEIRLPKTSRHQTRRIEIARD